jgi:hypothetical protein
MVFPSEKLQIFLSQFISGHALTSNWPNGRILKELYTIYRTLVNLPYQPTPTEKEPFAGSLKLQMVLSKGFPVPALWLFRKVQMQETARFAPAMRTIPVREPATAAVPQQMGLYQQPEEKISRWGASPYNP